MDTDGYRRGSQGTSKDNKEGYKGDRDILDDADGVRIWIVDFQ